MNFDDDIENKLAEQFQELKIAEPIINTDLQSVLPEVQRSDIVELHEKDFGKQKTHKIEGLTKGRLITIIPNIPICNNSLQLDARILGMHTNVGVFDITRLYLLEMQSSKCPPPTDLNGIVLVYWLAEHVDGSFAVYASRLIDTKTIRGTSSGNQRITLLKDKENIIPVKTVVVRTLSALNLPTGVILGDKQQMTGKSITSDEVLWGDRSMIRPDLSIMAPSKTKKTITIRMADGSTVSMEDQRQAAILQKQQDLLMAEKPPLIRARQNARAKGMGIRELQPEEFRREWRAFPKQTSLSIRVDITDEHGTYLTSIVMKSIIHERYENSPVLGNLGVLYELEIIEILGDDKDIYMFTPKQIGDRVIKYWLGIYYDLFDNKIVATSELVDHRQLSAIDGKDNILAEYAVGDVKKIELTKSTAPFIASVEMKSEPKPLLENGTEDTKKENTFVEQSTSKRKSASDISTSRPDIVQKLQKEYATRKNILTTTDE